MKNWKKILVSQNLRTIRNKIYFNYQIGNDELLEFLTVYDAYFLLSKIGINYFDETIMKSFFIFGNFFL